MAYRGLFFIVQIPETKQPDLGGIGRVVPKAGVRDHELSAYVCQKTGGAPPTAQVTVQRDPEYLDQHSIVMTRKHFGDPYDLYADWYFFTMDISPDFTIVTVDILGEVAGHIVRGCGQCNASIPPNTVSVIEVIDDPIATVVPQNPEDLDGKITLASFWRGLEIAARCLDPETDISGTVKVRESDSKAIVELLLGTSHTAGMIGAKSMNATGPPSDGAQLEPIHWVGPTSGPVSFTAGETTKLDLRGRARLSVWTSPQIHVTENHLFDDGVLSQLNAIDDVTFVQTVRVDDKGLPKWAWNCSNRLFGDKSVSEDQRKTDFFREAVECLHKKGIQAFAGFEIVTKGEKQNFDEATTFLTWLRNTEDFTEHAQKLLAWFSTRKIFIDGISYDLEITGLGTDERDRPHIAALYTAVAAELAKDGRYLAYAPAAAYKTAPKPDYLNPPVIFAQPYSLARLAPNIIVRPMAYDIGPKMRREMVDLSLNELQLHPGQLQVGVGTDTTEQPISYDDFFNECRDIYRLYRVGVILWHLHSLGPRPNNKKTATVSGENDAITLTDSNAVLNTDLPTASIGQPIQGPLSDERLAVLGAHSPD